MTQPCQPLDKSKIKKSNEIILSHYSTSNKRTKVYSFIHDYNDIKYLGIKYQMFEHAWAELG